MNRAAKYKDLYLCFLRIGAVNFGGGYAMLPLLQRDLEESRHWCTTDELMDYFAIGQCTPGIIALNVSTFVGNKIAGTIGAICAVAGFLTVPIALILVIAALLQNFITYPVVVHALSGIRVCVCVLVLQAVLRLWKKSIVDLKSLLLYIVIFLLTVFSGLLPVSVPTEVFVVAAGVFGILFAGNGGKGKTGEAEK